MQLTCIKYLLYRQGSRREAPRLAGEQPDVPLATGDTCEGSQYPRRARGCFAGRHSPAPRRHSARGHAVQDDTAAPPRLLRHSSITTAAPSLGTTHALSLPRSFGFPVIAVSSKLGSSLQNLHIKCLHSTLLWGFRVRTETGAARNGVCGADPAPPVPAAPGAPAADSPQ